MKLGANNQYNNHVSFKSNAGVLRAIKALEKDGGPKNIRELQAQALDAILTPEFIDKIEKVTPEDIKTLAKKVLGLIPWEKTI
jgi:hypothetical protein